MLAKIFLSDEVLNEIGQDINRDIVEELKAIKARIDEVNAGPNMDLEEVETLIHIKKELNKDRIKALNLKLINGGKNKE